MKILKRFAGEKQASSASDPGWKQPPQASMGAILSQGNSDIFKDDVVWQIANHLDWASRNQSLAMCKYTCDSTKRCCSCQMGCNFCRIVENLSPLGVHAMQA